MAAEKLDRIDVLEANLRKLITLKPDHAQAYNALGYTLADKTDRLKEAKDYVEKALKLSPEDEQKVFAGNAKKLFRLD